jgi:hypothetical protein
MIFGEKLINGLWAAVQVHCIAASFIRRHCIVRHLSYASLALGIVCTVQEPHLIAAYGEDGT